MTGETALQAPNPEPVTTLPPTEAQLAVMGLAAAYISHADGLGRGAPADLFTDAGVLTLGSLQLESREAIGRFFAERARDHADQQRTTRHVPGPMELQMVADDRITGRSTAIVFAGHGDLPLQADVPSTICDFDDIYERTPLGWKFASRTATVVFTGAGAATFAK